MSENSKDRTTLIRWMAGQIDGKNYRAGKSVGYRHPKVDDKILKLLGGRESLILQAREIEKDSILGNPGRIWFDWCDMNADIKTIHYCVDVMPELCKREGLEDPRKRQLRYIRILDGWKKRAGNTWLSHYYEEEINKLEEGLCSQTTRENIEEGHLYRCLDAILNLEEPVEKPIFSARLFKNVRIQGENLPPSKVFRKKYEGKVIAVLKKSPAYEEGMSDDEVLAANGILSYAQTLEWKGPLVYTLKEDIDSSVNCYGTIINSRTLEHAFPKSLPGVKKILIIENKANYEKECYKEDELLLFCHGFFSPKEVRFLRKITEIAEKEVQYYHWGDMDYGGIRIFQYNKANVFPKLKPYQMGREDYERAIAAGAGMPVAENKKEKLDKMDAGELEELKRCILEYGLEVEQELLAE